MPGVTLHFVLADEVLRVWRQGGTPPPFALDDPAALNAYYHGAVGPDLGYFPGGERILSDLAHCVRVGALARHLVAVARTERERAFAWGWVTHVLADQSIHPIIGRGVGEFLTGRRDFFVDGASDMLTHLRVEMGLDAWQARRFPAVRRRRLRDAFGPGEIDFLVRAYGATYGVTLDAELFLRSHRTTTVRVGQALRTIGLVDALMTGTGPLLPSTIGAVLRAAWRCTSFRSVALAYLTPVPPAGWLLEEVAGAMSAHTTDFMGHFESDGRGVPDLNLDTGRPLILEADHEGARRGLQGLATLAEMRIVAGEACDWLPPGTRWVDAGPSSSRYPSMRTA